MKTYLLDEVFGVSKNEVKSYIDRPQVDDAFVEALSGTRQIVVFGASKQGKSALMEKHLPEERRTVVHCGPNMGTADIYRSFLRQNNIEIVSGNESENSLTGKTSLGAKFKALLPFVGSGEANANAEIGSGIKDKETRVAIEFNLGAAQDVGELLDKLSSEPKILVLENFHYLDDDVQADFAFDLRTFEEMGIRFVILGVWREKNRLNQFNGDLQDRVTEIPVEPWNEKEFHNVITQGESALNIKFSDEIRRKVLSHAHGSIGVVQELLKNTCKLHGIEKTADVETAVTDISLFESAVSGKVADYATRHVRALETIAAGARTRRETEITAALYLPYYFVVTVIGLKFSEIENGIHKTTLRDKIIAVHHKPENVREADVSGMLSRLSSLQAKSKIVPPLFGYEQSTKMLRIFDSTLFFFLDNCNAEEVRSEIPIPDDLA